MSCTVPAAVRSDPVTAVVFDLGGVLIDWDPRYLYRKLMPEEDIDDFLAEIGFAEWNHAQDSGGTWEDAVASLSTVHPHRRELIEAYPRRFLETISGPIAGTVAILDELREHGVRLYALTNWSAETFVLARRAFSFLDTFEGIVVSGEEQVAKPDPAIYRILLDRFGLDPATTLFVDDSPRNVAAAATAGLRAVRFTDPAVLAKELREVGLLAQD